MTFAKNTTQTFLEAWQLNFQLKNLQHEMIIKTMHQYFEIYTNLHICTSYKSMFHQYLSIFLGK